MRTMLYASMTADGSFERGDGGRSIAPEVLGDFVAHVHRAGNVIVGRRTFELAIESGGGQALAGADVVVLSASEAITGVLVARGPEEALAQLRGRGHATALIGGGRQTDEAFLRAGLVDEVYLNVLPRHALAAAPTLLGMARLGAATVQLHYALVGGRESLPAAPPG